VPRRYRSDAVAIIDAASLIHARWVLRSAGMIAPTVTAIASTAGMMLRCGE
jgi:hypothetical protein